MKIIKQGYKWTRQKSGYYQSTTSINGKRKWLHREIYERENGEIKDKYEVHHKDENKDNNEPSNLEILSPEDHQLMHAGGKKHWHNREQRREYERQKRANNREQRNKNRICTYCNCKFEINDKAKNETKFCSESCRGKYSNLQKNENYAELTTKQCIVCNSEFEQKSANQICCSEECGKIHTEKNRRSKIEFRLCLSCNNDFETIRSSSRKFCSKECGDADRNKLTSKCTCRECGEEFMAKTTKFKYCSNSCKYKFNNKNRKEKNRTSL